VSEEIETLVEKTLMPVLKAVMLEFTPPATEDNCDESEELEDLVEECKSNIDEYFIKIVQYIVDMWLENMSVKQVSGYRCEIDVHEVESGIGWARYKYDVCVAIVHDNIHIHVVVCCFSAEKETYYVSDFYTYKKN